MQCFVKNTIFSEHPVSYKKIVVNKLSKLTSLRLSNLFISLLDNMSYKSWLVTDSGKPCKIRIFLVNVKKNLDFKVYVIFLLQFCNDSPRWMFIDPELSRLISSIHQSKCIFQKQRWKLGPFKWRPDLGLYIQNNDKLYVNIFFNIYHKVT